MYDINEVSKLTHLEQSFIRKCLKVFKHILSPHIKRGDNNKLLFNDNAIIIFDKIGQMKSESLSVSEIQKQFNIDFKPIKTENTKVFKEVQTETQTNQTASDSYNILLHSFLELQKGQEEKHNRILELSEALTTLKTELKLLPEGKTPAEIKTEWEKLQIKKLEKQRLIDGLYSVGVFSFWKRKKIYEEIKKLDE